MRKLLATQDDVALLIGRLTLAVVFWPHGAQKVLGLFGGPGPSAAFAALTTQMHVPGWLAGLVMAAEFVGPIGLLLGLLTRVAAFGLFCDMIGAVVLVHWRYGFFMNWYGAKAGEGFEYHLLALGLLLIVMIRGGGARSADLAWLRGLDYGRAPSRPREKPREPAGV